jgi:chemotaxis protein methyltransferase CheR
VFYRKGDSTRRLSIPVRDVHEPSSSAGVISNASSSPVLPALSAPAARRATTPSASDPLADAREAFTAGHYERVLALTHEAHDAAGAVLHLRAVANAHGSEEAARRAQQTIQRHPLSAELHLVHAVLLLDLKRHTDAERALKRVLYLDRSLAIASYLLGATLRDQGRPEEARRAYRNARDLARARPPDDELPLADGERAGAIVAIAEAEIALLDASRRVS